MLTQPALSPTTTWYVPALTGLRAVSVYLVFLHHYSPALPVTLAHRLLAQGYVGVSIFFVLSGFLIYHRHAPAYIAGEGWSWRGYLQQRFARIFPLYAILLVLTVVVRAMAGRAMGGLELLLNATLLKGLFEDYKFSGIAQSWSLTTEVCFYPIAPLFFVALRRWGAFLLTVGLVGAGVLLWVTVGSLGWHGLFGSLPFVLFYTFLGRAFEFVAGMWLARRWHEGRLPLVRFATAGGFILMGSCVVGQTMVLTGATDPDVLFWSELVAYNLVLPVGITGLLLGLLREPTFLRRTLTHPVVQALGRSSYAFYLIHVGVLAKGLQIIGVIHTGWLFGLLVLLAHGLYITVERPLQRRLRAS